MAFIPTSNFQLIDICRGQSLRKPFKPLTQMKTIKKYLKEELSLIWSLLMSLPTLVNPKGSHSASLFVLGRDTVAALQNLDCALRLRQEDISKIKSALHVVFDALYYLESRFRRLINLPLKPTPFFNS